MRIKKPAAKYHHGDLKAALLAAAGAVLEGKGAESFTLRDIARRAGVSEAAPYRHFANLDEITASLAAEGFEILETDIASALTAFTGEAAAAIAAAAEEWGRFAGLHPMRYRLMFRHPPAGAITALQKRLIAAAGKQILGHAATAAIHGAIDLCLAQGKTDDAAGAARQAARALFTRP